ncbi:MAG: 16S rRNA (guanine(966)-N(2))-methyltransferase RsmD [Gammaproteobacteria bacterium]
MKTNPSIRIISGSNKGFKINFRPSSKLRPTSDRLKKIAFDWVQFNILDSNCLDLFAGTGSLGLECLSRSASKVTFVDHTKDHINKINKLTGELNYKDKCECIRADVSAWMHGNEEVFDLIFMDPPYEFKDYEILLEAIALNKMLSKNGFIFLEHAARISINIPDTLKAIREKKVGEAKGQLIQWK